MDSCRLRHEDEPVDTIEKIIDQLVDAIAERVVAKLRVTEKKTYTLKEVAEVMNLCPRTIRRMKDDGRLKPIPGTAKLIFPAAEIDKLVKYGR